MEDLNILMRTWILVKSIEQLFREWGGTIYKERKVILPISS